MNASYPNILMILTDQQQRATMGTYGNPVVRTPHIDRFAENATVFENAVCAMPVCVPSRCSIFSGVFPHTHGVNDNYHSLPRRFPTIAELLIDHNVRTGYIGKFHLDPWREVLPQRGFEEFYRSVDDDYTLDRDFPLYGLCHYSQWLVEQGYAPDANETQGRFSREFTASLPETQSKAAFVSREACRFLEHRRNEQFFLVCGFLEPHNPYHSPYDHLHDPSDIALPANFHAEPLPNWPERNIRFQQWARECAHEDTICYDTADKWRDLIARYYGLCHLLDRHVGRILDKLEELNLDRNTLVVFTSDHGDMMGSHGMYMKSMMYEESQGVPLLVRHPSYGGGRVIGEPVSQVDLVPTLLHALGADPPPHLQGQSLMPLLAGERDEDSEAVVCCEWNGVIQRMFSKWPLFADVKNNCIRSVRTQRWKLNVNPGDISELYDLLNDPGEMVNLIHNPACRPTVENLFQRLREWQRNTGDTLELTQP